MVYPLYATYLDNILLGGTISGTAAASSYSIQTLATLDAAQRIVWSSGTVTMTWTLGSSKTGDVAVIPMHGFDVGGGVVTITNAAGLSFAVTVPALQVDGFPPVLVVDFSAASNRTSNVWHVVVTGNSRNLIMGAAVAIYPKKTLQNLTFNGGVFWQYKESETPNISDVVNEYDSHFLQDYGTTSAQVQVTAYATEDNMDTIRNWFRANRGRMYPSFFQWDPTRTGKAMLGHWSKTFERGSISGTKRSVTATIDQFSRGLVI